MHENQIKIFHFKDDLKVVITNFLLGHNASIGGCRHQPYPSIHYAINDSYDLCYAMALKAFHLGIPYGGAKSVIYNPNQLPFEQIAPYLGQAINAFEGTYIASIDIGVGSQEIGLLAQYTDFHYGTPAHIDPSEYTAEGVIQSLNYLISNIPKESKDIAVAIQGLGKVGSLVANHCIKMGIKVYAADINKDTIKPFLSYPNFIQVHCNDILNTPCDILVPAAGGNVINESNIDSLKTNYICSVANNPIQNPLQLTDQLLQRNIIFIPDFIINSGGLLSVANALEKNKEKQLNIDCIPNKVSSLMNAYQGENLYRKAIEQFEAGINLA